MLSAVLAKNLFTAVSQATASRLSRSMPDAKPVPKANVQLLLKETAVAFWRNVESASLHRQLEDRDSFTKVYREWKESEKQAGHMWRGGVAQVFFALVRMKKIKKKKIKKVKNSTVVFASPGGVAAAVERVKNSRKRIAENKYGIEVSMVEFDQVVSVGATCSKLIYIRNTAQQELWLETIEMLTMHCFSVSLERGTLPIQLHTNASTTLIVKFQPTTAGISKSTLSLTFKGTSSSGRFTIGRFLEGRWYVCM
jgi:hypothetical protein